MLDTYCGKCHQGDGEGRQTFDQTPRSGPGGFDETYWTLIGAPSWGAEKGSQRSWAQPGLPPYPKDPPPGWGYADMIEVEAFDTKNPLAYQTPKPMTKLSYKSRLVELAANGKHHDVRVDDLSLQRLICWVDTMCPYMGDEEVRAEADPVFQGVEWLAVRPKIKNAPHIARPGPVE